MAKGTPHAAALAAALLIGGCSFAEDALWPSLTGDSPTRPAPQQPQTAQAQAVQIAPAPAEANQAPTLGPAAAPALGTSTFAPPGVTPGSPTGTFVGQKVNQMRAELGQLQQTLVRRNSQLQTIRNSTTQNSQRYHGTVAAVTTRLQMGTTPGNPVLVGQWNQAQADLDRLASDIAAMNSLANEVAADAAMSSYLLDAAKATYGLSGAIDEDHRQLRILEDETNRTVVLVDRLLHELTDDVTRQTTYIGAERSNLTTLALAIKNGELLGPSLGSRSYAAVLSGRPAAGAGTGLEGATAPRGAFGADGRQPLVVIRFDRQDVPYQQALYNAVSKALERRPQAAFDLVAVAASTGTPTQAAANQNLSRRNAERVLRTLTEMGLPPQRVMLSATSSTQIATNEVHLYVR